VLYHWNVVGGRSAFPHHRSNFEFSTQPCAAQRAECRHRHASRLTTKHLEADALQFGYQLHHTASDKASTVTADRAVFFEPKLETSTTENDGQLTEA